VDGAALPVVVAAGPELTLAHVGSLYGGRSLGPVLEAMRRILDGGGAGHSSMRLRLVGRMDGPHLAELERERQRLALGAHVDILGPLPRSEALEVLARSRVALIVAQGQDMMVPAKLYEPVAMGMRTLVLAPPTSDAAAEGRRLGARVVDPDDTTGVEEALRSSLREESWPRPDPGPAGYEVVARQADAILRDVCRAAT
jgi:hypothetical protein